MATSHRTSTQAPQPLASETGATAAESGDLAFALALVAAGAIAALGLPAGSVVRALVAAPVVLAVPGYLLVEAMRPRASASRPGAGRFVLSLGLSPPLVALAALATALVPGGFRPAPIVAAVTVLCVALAAAAWYQRRARPVAPAAASRDPDDASSG